MATATDVNVLDNAPAPLVCRADRGSGSRPRGKAISSRESIRQSLFDPDSRFLLVVGPCSIHDTEACLA